MYVSIVCMHICVVIERERVYMHICVCERERKKARKRGTYIYIIFNTSWQHRQDWYRLVTMHTHGDFIVLPHWVMRLPAP